MNLLEQKVPSSLLDKTEGYISQASLVEMKQKENAALVMCGGLLGNCYLMAEITENLIIEAFSKFKKEKWFKHNIKRTFKLAYESLHAIIANSIHNSPTKAEYMKEISDALYDILKKDLFILETTITNELYRRKVQDMHSLAQMVVIDTMLRSINIEYDEVIKHMKTIFNTYYESWYYPAKCDKPAYWWNSAMQLYAKDYLSGQINFNEFPGIDRGINIIQNKLHSAEISKIVKEQASKYTDDGGGQLYFNKALQILEK